MQVKSFAAPGDRKEEQQLVSKVYRAKTEEPGKELIKNDRRGPEIGQERGGGPCVL